MIIDTTKAKYKHLPKTLNGDIFLDYTRDKDGNITGVLSIDPGVLKFITNGKTPAEIAAMGYDRHADKILFVKSRPDILPVDPSTRR